VNIFGIEVPATLLAFVQWIASPAVAALIVSVGLERWSWFQSLTSSEKTYGVLLLFVGLPFVSQILAFALAQLPADVVATVNGVYVTALSGLAAWALSQFVHKWDKSE